VNGDGVVNDFDRERWVFFGTVRFLVRDDAENTDQQSFYGIKEPIGASNHFSGGTVNRSNLLNVTNAETYDEMEVAGVQVAKVTGLSGITTWEQLLEQIDLHDGWYQNFSEPKERNIGQASMFDEILAFTTYVPALDICAFEGESWLSAVYYRTGTASFENIIGFIHDDVNHNSIVDPGEQRMIKKVNLGRGLALTVNLHTGRAEGAAGLAQNSLGNIVKKKFTNVNTKSRKVSWQLR
jgi:type IV pilus assembly protein PilY1